MCMMMAGMLGGAISAIGSIAKGQAESDADKRQAQQYQTQSQLDQRQSAAEEIAGQQKQRAMVDKAGQMAGQQITGYAAGGVTLSGSPTSIISDSRREAMLDVAAVKYNTDLTADNDMYKARVDNVNADSSLKAADSAQEAGALGALSGIVGGITGGGGGGGGGASMLGGLGF